MVVLTPALRYPYLEERGCVPVVGAIFGASIEAPTVLSFLVGGIPTDSMLRMSVWPDHSIWSGQAGIGRPKVGWPKMGHPIFGRVGSRDGVVSLRDHPIFGLGLWISVHGYRLTHVG